MTAPVAFLSGAGLPSWTWDEVRAGLTGQRTLVVEPPHRSASLVEHAESALAQAAQQRSAATVRAAWTETVDGGHLAPLEHPDAVLRAIQRLLSERPA